MNNQSLAELPTVTTQFESPTLPGPALATPKYYHAIGYLRAFIVALVVAHHAALAYFPLPFPPPVSLLAQPRLWQAFPVRDAHAFYRNHCLRRLQ